MKRPIDYGKAGIFLLGLGMLSLGYAQEAIAADQSPAQKMQTLSRAVISRTGFSWWHYFSRDRRIFRREVRRCMAGQHENACWAGLSAQLNRVAQEEWAPSMDGCIGVQIEAQRYWRDLANYAALSAGATTPGQNRKAIGPIARRLQRVEKDLRRMADAGRCPGD